MPSKQPTDYNNLGLEFTRIIHRTQKNLTQNESLKSNTSTSQQRKQAIDALSHELREISNFFPTANEFIKDSVKDFACEIIQKPLTFTAQPHFENQVIYGRTQALKLFCDFLEPAIDRCYPKNSDGYLILQHAHLWPFRQQLLCGEGLEKKVHRLCLILRDEEMSFEAYRIDRSKNSFYNRTLLNTIESLSLVAAQLTILLSHISTSNDQMRWCELCFRRADNTSKFCPAHNSKTNNTNYSRAVRVQNCLESGAKNKIRNYQQLRGTLGDAPCFLFSDPAAIDNIVNQGHRGFFLKNDEIEFYLQTWFGNWTIYRRIWIDGIEKDLPSLAGQLRLARQCYTQSSSWEQFVSAIFDAIDEHIETSTHPYWVLQIMILANQWFAAENQNSDKRVTGKKAKILQLAAENLPQREIAQQVGVGPSYVSRVLKAYSD